MQFSSEEELTDDECSIQKKSIALQFSTLSNKAYNNI